MRSSPSMCWLVTPVRASAPSTPTAAERSTLSRASTGSTPVSCYPVTVSRGAAAYRRPCGWYDRSVCLAEHDVAQPDVDSRDDHREQRRRDPVFEITAER